MSDGEAVPEESSPPQPAANPLLAMAVAWVFPGAGHLFLGRRVRALVFLVVIGCCLLVGLSLDGNLYRVVPNRPLTVLATLASMGMGAPYFVLRYLVGYEGQIVAPGYEYGSAFILTAGLMNLLLVLDARDIATGRKS